MLAYGDRVKYARTFLCNIGAYTGTVPFRTGTVNGVTESSAGALVYVHWHDGGAGYVLADNLVNAKRLHLEKA